MIKELEEMKLHPEDTEIKYQKMNEKCSITDDLIWGSGEQDERH